MATSKQLQNAIDIRLSNIQSVRDSCCILLDCIHKTLSVLHDNAFAPYCAAYSYQYNQAVSNIKAIVELSESAMDEYREIRSELYEPIPPISRPLED